jgi:hypothetical protein
MTDLEWKLLAELAEMGYEIPDSLLVVWFLQKEI